METIRNNTKQYGNMLDKLDILDILDILDMHNVNTGNTPPVKCINQTEETKKWSETKNQDLNGKPN